MNKWKVQIRLSTNKRILAEYPYDLFDRFIGARTLRRDRPIECAGFRGVCMKNNLNQKEKIWEIHLKPYKNEPPNTETTVLDMK